MTTSTEPAQRVLVVDDSSDNRRLVAACLRDQKLIIDEASDGRSAVQIAFETHPQLIIIDLDLPFLDGLGVVRIVREQGLSSGDVRIIALTAAVEEDALLRCVEAGTDDYLAKPLTNLSELRSKVRSHLTDLRRSRVPTSERASREAHHSFDTATR